MTRQDDRRREVVRFYDEFISDRSGSEVLGYSSSRSQEVRFAALADIADLSGCSVLDVGCGRGDLCGWLRTRCPDVDYRGVDIHPRMIELARRTWPGERFDFRDILDDDSVGEADYVLSSGLFTVPVNGEPEFVDRMLARMMALARRGVAVNFLSDRTPNPMDARSFYSDPVTTLERALRLTPNVTLRHDYKPNDFAIHLRHAAPGAPE